MRRWGTVLLALALSTAAASTPGAAQDDDARAPAARGGDSGDGGLREALQSHYAALEGRDPAAAGRWLRPDFFYIAPWGALEMKEEMLGRYRVAFDAGRLRNYRVELRGLHSGPAGEGARWFRAIVREKYERESGRSARNAFAEDLLTSGVAVYEDGGWRIQHLQQTWSDETLRRMVPILHAAQPVDPEEY